jgi:pimeloyl-ACP methyl ester carboxylesterase
MKSIVIVLSLLASTTLYADDHPYEFKTINGNQVAWSCRGEGKYTIILISGMGLPAHQSFGNTYHRYAGPGRICLYDRAELGASKKAQAAPRTLADIATELHELATTLGWENQILVAHSFGGYIARQYIAQYPKTVLGVLFVDCLQEGFIPALHQRMSEQDWAQMQRAIDWQLKSTSEDFLQAQSVAEHFGKLGSLPITLITRGIPQTNLRQAGMSYGGVDVFNEEHQKAQQRLLQVSTDSKQVIAKYASHVVDEFDPWLIDDEIVALQTRVELVSPK